MVLGHRRQDGAIGTTPPLSVTRSRSHSRSTPGHCPGVRHVPMCCGLNDEHHRFAAEQAIELGPLTRSGPCSLALGLGHSPVGDVALHWAEGAGS